jgi:hypothetical protein
MERIALIIAGLMLLIVSATLIVSGLAREQLEEKLASCQTQYRACQEQDD